MIVAVRGLDGSASRTPSPKRCPQPQKRPPEPPKDTRVERLDEERRLARIRADEIC